MPKGKSVNRRCIMYCQQLAYLNYDSIEELIDNVDKELGNIYQYAWIVHESDIDEETGKLKAPHIHIVFYDENKLALFKLKDVLKDNEEQHYEFMRRKDAAFLYLIHGANADRNKYQYSIDDVKANFDYVEYINNMRSSYQKVTLQSLLEDVLDSRIKFVDIQNDNELSIIYSKHKSKIDNALNIASKRRAELKKSTDVPVVWIYGKSSGIGKTLFATKQANKLEKAHSMSTYITSANNDPFQDYKGQEIIILDDIKPNDIEFSDLLRLLDPYNSTSVRARYSNKYISADVIFITTMYSPEEFFMESNIDHAKEPIDQLLRRIATVCYIEPTDDDSYLGEVSFYKMDKLDMPIYVDGKFDYVSGGTVKIKSNYGMTKIEKKN